MTRLIFSINDFSISLLKSHGYILDPTHVYWYKKIADDVEIEVQNQDNDLYIKGQVIIHAQNACIIDNLDELKYILFLSIRSDK